MWIRASLLGVGVILAAHVPVWAAETPMAVSPGSPTGAAIESRCPTFSWGAVASARALELVVYRVHEEGQEAEAVLEREVHGSASSWTPPLGSCLKRGGRYAWSVRSLGADTASDWSAPSLFKVAAGPTRVEFEKALAVVKDYLREGSSSSEEPSKNAKGLDEVTSLATATSAASRGALSENSARAAVPEPVAPLASLALSLNDNLQITTGNTPRLRLEQDTSGSFASRTWDIGANETNLFVEDENTGHLPFRIEAGAPNHSLVVGALGVEVDGAPVVTTANGECEGFVSLGRRYFDRGDGTVRDCNTGKIWLRDASCLGVGTWDDTVPFDPGSAQAKIADLNDTATGVDFGCTDYTDGTYTDWVLPDMEDLCGLWNGTCAGTDCCDASQGIVDTTVLGSPKVANGKGDSAWTPGNTFVGIKSVPSYYSANAFEANPDTHAWAAFLNDGNVTGQGHLNAENILPVRDP